MSQENRIIKIHCQAILCDNSFEVTLPEGWSETIEMDFGEEEGCYLYCPEHALQRDWFDAQCPGCVGDFPHCKFADSFMYSRSQNITSAQIQSISQGICPFRTNGTFSFGGLGKGIEDIDLSDRATVESGNAVASAVEDYMQKYPGQP